MKDFETIAVPWVVLPTLFFSKEKNKAKDKQDMRPRFGQPQEATAWKGIVKSEQTVLKRQELENAKRGFKCAPVDPSFKGPLDGGDGCNLARGSTVVRATGHTTRNGQGEPPTRTPANGLMSNPHQEQPAHVSSNGAYGWFAQSGKDSRGDAKTYHGLKKTNLFS